MKDPSTGVQGRLSTTLDKNLSFRSLVMFVGGSSSISIFSAVLSTLSAVS